MAAIDSPSEQQKNLRAFMREYAKDLANYFNQYFNQKALQETIRHSAYYAENKSEPKYALPNQPAVNTVNDHRIFTSTLRNLVDDLINAMTSIVDKASATLQSTAQNIMKRLHTSDTNKRHIMRATHSAAQHTMPTLITLLKPVSAGQRRRQPESNVTHDAIRPYLDRMFAEIDRDGNEDSTENLIAAQGETFNRMCRYAYLHIFAEELHDRVQVLEYDQQDLLFEEAAKVVFDDEFLQSINKAYGEPMFMALSSALHANQSYGLDNQALMTKLGEKMDDEAHSPMTRR